MLPTCRRKEGRFYTLGWDLKNARLQELVRLHTQHSMAHVSYAAQAKHFLEELTRYSGLHVNSVLDPEKLHEGKGTKMVVAISFTAETRFFFLRPSQWQYYLLVRTFGEHPRLYEYALPNQFFLAYCIR